MMRLTAKESFHCKDSLPRSMPSQVPLPDNSSEKICLAGELHTYYYCKNVPNMYTLIAHIIDSYLV